MMYNFTFCSGSLTTSKIRSAERNPTLFVFTQGSGISNVPKFPKALGSLHLYNFRTYSNTELHALKVDSLSPSLFTRSIVSHLFHLTQPTKTDKPTIDHTVGGKSFSR